jgi:hypothetical protein
MQVGGGHYKDRETQHWDVIDRNGIGYLEGVATKYLCRYKEKNGLQDLKKAEHYVIKLLEEVNEHCRRPRGQATMMELRGLREGYKLESTEYGAVAMLLTWSDRDHLIACLDDIRDLIMWEEQRLKEASSQSQTTVG